MKKIIILFLIWGNVMAQARSDTLLIHNLEVKLHTYSNIFLEVHKWARENNIWDSALVISQGNKLDTIMKVAVQLEKLYEKDSREYEIVMNVKVLTINLLRFYRPKKKLDILNN